MITKINFDRWKYFDIETDNWCLSPIELKITRVDRVWDWKSKKLINKNVTEVSKYYEWVTETGYAFKYTQFPLVLSYYVILGILSVNDYLRYMTEFNMPNISSEEIPRELGSMTMRDDQMDTLRKLMTKRFGICHIYTGFGKTEMIAFMCYYYTKVLNWKVLVTAPNAKVLNEIVKRINDRLNTSIGVNYPNDSGILAINAGSVSKQKYNHHHFKDYLSEIKVILSDEVDACLTPTHHQIYEYCSNRECMYGFSATPDCYCGKLDINSGITETSFRNKGLLDTFGGSLVNITPSGFEVNIIQVNLPWWKCIDRSLIEQGKRFMESGDISSLPTDFRLKLDNDLLKRGSIARLLHQLSKRFPNLMVTINRTEIIDCWISNLPDCKILEISGRGYIERYKGESRNLTQDEIKETYLDYELILGTRSLFRGVDLPELHSSVQLSGVKSGTTIQSIGRTARRKLMNVILLNPGEFILGFSNQNTRRIELIKSQYPTDLNHVRFSIFTDSPDSI